MVTKNYKTYLIEKEKEYSQDESNLNIPYKNDRQYARAMQTQRDRERRDLENPSLEKLKEKLETEEKYLAHLKATNNHSIMHLSEKRIQELKDKIKQKESEEKNG
jgi:hypothetical protein